MNSTMSLKCRHFNSLFSWGGIISGFLFDDLPTFKLNKGVFPCTRNDPLPISPNFLLPIRGDNIKTHVVRMTLAICEKLHEFMGTQRGKKVFSEEGKTHLIIFSIESNGTSCKLASKIYLFLCTVYEVCDPVTSWMLSLFCVSCNFCL